MRVMKVKEPLIYAEEGKLIANIREDAGSWKNDPYCKTQVNNDEIKIVARGIMSGMLAKGKVVAKFETAFAKYDGVNHAE